jgi:dephospho-CoA kinase
MGPADHRRRVLTTGEHELFPMSKGLHRLLFVTGASGTGKTSTVRLLEKRRTDIIFRFFDKIGVPSLHEMIARYVSGEEWQRQKTLEWVTRIKVEDLGRAPVIFDGQARQAFVDEACALAGVYEYRIVLFDCEDAVREQRLVARGHTELANGQMTNWARYLREQALRRKDPVIDTTCLTLEGAMNELETLWTQLGRQ